MRFEQNTLLTVAALLFILTNAFESSAAVITPPQEQDRVDVSVSVDVQFDGTTNLYTYTYTVTSLPTSQQEVATFAIAAEGDISNIQSPQGWRGGKSLYEPMLYWGAIGMGPEGDKIPSHNDITPSPYQIKPGESLGGFSFQSSGPATPAKYYAQGFAPLPAADDGADAVDEGIPDLPFKKNSKTGFTVGPGLKDPPQN